MSNRTIEQGDSPMSESEIEARLTETLRAVAEQTTADSKLGFLPTADTNPTPGAGPRSRGLWMAAAAVAAVVAGTATYLTVAGGETGGPDIGTVEPAEQPEVDLDRVDDEGNPIDPAPIDPAPTDPAPGGDGSGSPAAASDLDVTLPDPDAGDTLYLVPADRSGLIDSIELAAGPEVSNATSLSMALIGRRTDGVIEQPYVVYQADASDPFAIDRETTESVAGVELFDSFDEGVGQELDDATWIIYQTEFGDPLLEELVTGVRIIDGVIGFEPDPDGNSDLELIAVVDQSEPEASMTIIHEPDGDPTSAPEGRAPDFRLFTARADDPTEAAVLAADFAAAGLRETMVGDRPGYLWWGPSPNGAVSIIGWSPVDGYVAAMIVWGLDEADAVDFAASMVPVDEATWRAELEG